MLVKKAFSLIELLVVMGIVAILCSSAVPAYHKYLIKAQVVQLLSNADSYKLAFLEESKAVYRLDTDLIEFVALDFVAGTPNKRVIHVASKIQDKMVLQLHGTDDGEIIKWTCHVNAAHNKYVPKNCRNNNLENISVA